MQDIYYLPKHLSTSSTSTIPVSVLTLHPVSVCVCAGVWDPNCVFYLKARCVGPAPLRAVRISGITRSNSAVGLIDARGLTTSHSRHILTGVSYRQGLARALLLPSKENKRRDIRALFQRRGPFCLCLISLRKRSGKRASQFLWAPTAEPWLSGGEATVVSCVCSATLSITPHAPLTFSLFHHLCLWISGPRRLCSFDYREIRSHNTGGRSDCGGR